LKAIAAIDALFKARITWTKDDSRGLWGTKAKIGSKQNSKSNPIGRKKKLPYIFSAPRFTTELWYNT